jgi:hypothetical protein
VTLHVGQQEDQGHRYSGLLFIIRIFIDHTNKPDRSIDQNTEDSDHADDNTPFNCIHLILLAMISIVSVVSTVSIRARKGEPKLSPLLTAY